MDKTTALYENWGQFILSWYWVLKFILSWFLCLQSQKKTLISKLRAELDCNMLVMKLKSEANTDLNISYTKAILLNNLN